MSSREGGSLQLELPYEVKLEVFEGPLDLLLHLVRKHELDIFQIPVAFILSKYLEVLDLMKSLNLDVAGEFLYYAALLAHIKSKQMLPPDEEGLEGDEEEGGDPARLLAERLLEYQAFREAAEDLGSLPQVGRTVWLRGAGERSEESDEASMAPFAEVSLFKLVDAMAKVLARARPEATHDVLIDRLSVADRINELLDRLQVSSRMTFSSTFEGLELGPGFRIRVVTTFLAVLEMARQRLIRIHQPEGDGEIYIERSLQTLVIPDEAFEEDQVRD
ncbi:MAG: segregation/condensation protein A [Polyangia bacterium]|mgnify:CR=1 FL=1|jgi:segregation and condensation protein A|nr:segregation/condensation protein A [Polyangia bacterium]